LISSAFLENFEVSPFFASAPIPALPLLCAILMYIVGLKVICNDETFFGLFSMNRSFCQDESNLFLQLLLLDFWILDLDDILLHLAQP